MRVALISYEYPTDIGLGGIGTYTRQAAQALIKEGVEVEVFCGSFAREGSFDDSGIPIHCVRCLGPWDFRAKVVAPFAAVHQQQPFNIIESPEIHGNAWEIKNAFPDLPLVVRLHAPNQLVEQLKKAYTSNWVKWRYFLGALSRGRWDLGFWRKPDFFSDPDYQFLKLADGLVAPSHAMKNWVIRYWKVAPDKIDVIPNVFTPPPSFLEIDRKDFHRRVVFFGRLNVLKGLIAATKAMKIFLSKNPEWKWKVIGNDGPSHLLNRSMKQWMQEELEEVADQVEFVEGVAYSQLPAELKSADVALLPSLFESFSYTCVEALTAGLPVIGSKIGGMADLIQERETGWLVNPYEPKEILKVLNSLEKEKVRLMQEKARKSVGKESGKELVQNYKKFYDKTLVKTTY